MGEKSKKKLNPRIKKNANKKSKRKKKKIKTHLHRGE